MTNFHALLVGINEYAPGSIVPTLRGCANDVTAMHESLRRLTGAGAENFLVLVNEQATRDAIVAGWRKHLRDRVQPGDVVYFHYSGHGSRARSDDPDAETGFTESLVAYDSRLKGKFDLLDKELALLIAEVEQAGAQVILFLDCCHSGGATRAEAVAAVRRCLVDDRIRPAESLLVAGARAKTRSPSGWALGEGYLVCAACRADELANEYYAAELGQWRGAATYFFLQMLHANRPETTWADVRDQLAARVHTVYATQSPQVEGPTHLRLFGGAGAKVGGYLLVTAVQDDIQIKLDGGLASGIVEGSRLAIYPPGSALLGEPLAVGVVTEAALDHVWARLNRPSPIETASRARILSFGYGEQALSIACDEPALRAAINSAEAGGPSPFIRLVDSVASTATEAADLIISVENGRYVARDPAGSPVLRINLPVGEGSAAAMHSLEHIAIFRNVRALRNLALDSTLASDVVVTKPVRIKPSRSGRTEAGQKSSLLQMGGELVAAPGQVITFDVINQSSQRVYVTVFQLGADYSIQQIAPPKGEGRQVTLDPGRILAVRRKLDLSLSEEGNGLILFKVFVVKDKMSLNVLTLPALNAGPIRLNSQVRDAGPLSGLLDAVRRTGTRPIRFVDEDDMDDRWWVHQFEIRVVESQTGV